ncbi:ATP-binding protein [Janibacter alittae]|uniref:Sensor-like histidine kinase SenX3 n=1 Tax=Janibacter alittae TaxID=3115209 RepID=A0ABZ2MJU8_9MICO
MRGRTTVAQVLRRLVAVLSVIILMMSLLAISSIVVIQREVRQTAQTVTPLVEETTRLRVEVTEAHTEYRSYLLTRDQRYRERYVAARESFEQERDEFLRFAVGNGLDTEPVEAFLDSTGAWFTLADADLAAGSELDEDAVEKTARAFDRTTATHENVVHEIALVRQERRHDYRTAMTASVVLMVLATVLALGVTVHQSRRALRRLAQPLHALHQVVARHESGDGEARADTEWGAAEVVDLAAAFNSLVEANSVLLRERERRLELHRVTADLPAVLAARDGGWDRACEQLGTHLAARAVSVYRLADDDVAALMGGWDASGAPFAGPVHELTVPGLVEMLSNLPILRAGSREEIEATFPGALLEVAQRRSFESWVLHPMRIGDEAVGALSVASDGRQAWDEAEIQAMARVAEYAAHTLVEQHYITSLEELDQQKTDFMATTSHELRTPLTSIAGYLELLEDGDYGDLTQPQTRALGVISRNVERLRSLIDDLLLLNRLDSGRATTQRVAQDVGSSAARVVEQMAPVAAAAGVDLALERSGGPVTAVVDPSQIERAIGNLVSNAVKFTPTGGHVRVAVSGVDGEIHIACTDTGMGIPQEDQEHLFTRFFRASNAQAGEVPGTGLGLAIVETIAVAHGGRIALESVQGEGTTVTITLPAGRAD